jgi:hypothetical protein
MSLVGRRVVVKIGSMKGQKGMIYHDPGIVPDYCIKLDDGKLIMGIRREDFKLLRKKKKEFNLEDRVIVKRGGYFEGWKGVVTGLGQPLFAGADLGIGVSFSAESITMVFFKPSALAKLVKKKVKIEKYIHIDPAARHEEAINNLTDEIDRVNNRLRKLEEPVSLKSSTEQWWAERGGRINISPEALCLSELEIAAAAWDARIIAATEANRRAAEQEEQAQKWYKRGYEAAMGERMLLKACNSKRCPSCGSGYFANFAPRTIEELREDDLAISQCELRRHDELVMKSEREQMRKLIRARLDVLDRFDGEGATGRRGAFRDVLRWLEK